LYQPQQHRKQELVFSITKVVCASPDPAWAEEVECEEYGGNFTKGEEKMARLGIAGKAWVIEQAYFLFRSAWAFWYLAMSSFL
jgi:hypothetical protein